MSAILEETPTRLKLRTYTWLTWWYALWVLVSLGTAYVFVWEIKSSGSEILRCQRSPSLPAEVSCEQVRREFFGFRQLDPVRVSGVEAANLDSYTGIRSEGSRGLTGRYTAYQLQLVAVGYAIPVGYPIENDQPRLQEPLEQIQAFLEDESLTSVELKFNKPQEWIPLIVLGGLSGLMITSCVFGLGWERLILDKILGQVIIDQGNLFGRKQKVFPLQEASVWVQEPVKDETQNEFKVMFRFSTDDDPYMLLIGTQNQSEIFSQLVGSYLSHQEKSQS
ncbi:MAG: hypothetical protein HC921_08045 [Synechococcaceae cyanobacterium SM2_3_1]|nr:hypothetical protein [Synechococcaceae cyanobacterium SM2_3_1]